MIELDVEYLGKVKKILKNRIPHCEVWAFGSRVNGSPKKYSDLDLVIYAPKMMDAQLLANLSMDFSESDLPIKIDLVEWVRISEEMKNIILENNEIVQKP